MTVTESIYFEEFRDVIIISRTIKRARSNTAKIGLFKLLSRRMKKVKVNELIKMP